MTRTSSLLYFAGKQTCNQARIRLREGAGRRPQVEYDGLQSSLHVRESQRSTIGPRKMRDAEDFPKSSLESDEPGTILEGRLPDQAALHGLLETLYALHLPILDVTKLDG